MRLTFSQKLEKRRLKAGILFKQGYSQAKVARTLRVTRAAVHYWRQDYVKQGMRGLKSKGPVGFSSKLTKKDKNLFRKAILKGPLFYGYETDLWTIPRLKAILKKVTRVSFGNVWVWNIVRNLGFTPQKPQVKAVQRNDKKIKEWKDKTLPGLKKMGKQTWALSGI